METHRESLPDDDPSASARILERLRAHRPAESRYRIETEIGRGGMGAVFKVWDDDLRRVLAMKVALASEATVHSSAHDEKVLARFLEEAQVTGQLDHPGIVPVHELGLAADGRVYFTMRMVKGQELKAIFDLVREKKDGWNQARALGVLLKVCEAMSYAHSKGVVHRDLKPANVMVGKFGEVYVMDWGLARVADRADRHDVRISPGMASTFSVVRSERKEQRDAAPDSPLITMDGDVVGTPAYMPPEQAKGQLDRLGAHSDVYALGAMVYHLLAGEMPYVPRDARISQHTVLMRVIEGPPRPLCELAPDTREELIAICEKAMERDVERRYRDMGELADDLRAFVEGGVVRAYQSSPSRRIRSYWRRQAAPTRIGLVTGYVVLPLVFAGLFCIHAINGPGTILLPALIVVSVAMLFGGMFVPKKPKLLGAGALLAPVVVAGCVLGIAWVANLIADTQTPRPAVEYWTKVAVSDVQVGRYAEALAAMQAVPANERRPYDQVELARAFRAAGKLDLALQVMDDEWDRIELEDQTLTNATGLRDKLRQLYRFGEWRTLILLELSQPERAREELTLALQK